MLPHLLNELMLLFLWIEFLVITFWKNSVYLRNIFLYKFSFIGSVCVLYFMYQLTKRTLLQYSRVSLYTKFNILLCSLVSIKKFHFPLMPSITLRKHIHVRSQNLNTFLEGWRSHFESRLTSVKWFSTWVKECCIDVSEVYTIYDSL